MKRLVRVRSLVIVALVLSAVAAGAFAAAAFSPRSSAWWTDSRKIRVPADSVTPREILWEPPVPIGGVLETPLDQYEPRVSADGSVLLFVRGRAGGGADLWQAARMPAGWGDPAPIAELNTPHDELGPELSPDGATLYFASDRPGGVGGYDLWRSARIGTGLDARWGDAVNLGSLVNTTHDEYSPALTPDGTSVYFASNRPREFEPAPAREGWAATVRGERSRHDFDLYRAALGDELRAAPVALATLNTPADEGCPAVSPAGDFLYFASDRPGTVGGFDVFRSRLLGTTVGQAESLGPAVNTPTDELDPALTAEGFKLLFSSNRAADETPLGTRAPIKYSLWSTTSREVFREYEPARSSRASELFGEIWPWLLALLLLLLLALLLLWALRSEPLASLSRRLGLLARCLLFSLVVHLVLASLFTVWKVTSTITSFLKHSGGTRVVLSSGADSAAFAQIRSFPSSAPSPVVADTSPAMPTPLAPLDSPMVVSDLPHTETAVGVLAGDMPPAAAPLPDVRSTPPALFEIASAAPAISLPPRPTPARTLDAPSPTAIAPAPLAAGAETRLAADPSPQIETPPPLPRPGTEVPLISPSAALDAPVAVPAPTRDPQPVATTLSLTAPAIAPRSLPSAPPREPAQALEEPFPIAERSLPPRADADLHVPSATAGASTLIDTPLPPPTPVELASHPGVADSLLEARSDMPRTAINDRSAVHPVPLAPNLATAIRLPERERPRDVDPGPARDSADQRREQTPPMNRAVGVTLPGPSLQPTFVETPIGNSGRGRAAGEPLALVNVNETHRPAPGVSAVPPRAPVPLAGSAVAPRLPSAEPPPEPVESFKQRDPERRAEVLENTGGSAETERAVALALEWFARHQSPDGSWSGLHFDDPCGACRDPAEFDSPAAMTGLSLLCFLGAGHTHEREGPYRASVRGALDWLVARQEDSGDLRHGETMYSQTVATVALCEAYAMTKDARLADAARRAIAFVLDGRRADRETAAGTSVIGWQVMAVESARRAGLPVPEDTFDAAARWLDSVADARTPGLYAYVRAQTPSAAMTAEAMFVQQLLGRTRDEPRMQESAEFIIGTPPRWSNGAPTYYWYYATLALFQHQGDEWERWNRDLTRELLANQRTQGPAAGSWDPQDRWSRLGGRIYQTAVCTLSLEVYYRYRAAGTPAPR